MFLQVRGALIFTSSVVLFVIVLKNGGRSHLVDIVSRHTRSYPSWYKYLYYRLT